MILAAALLLAAPDTRHCADPVFCPSRAEVEAAIRHAQYDREWALNTAANPPGSDAITYVVIRSIRRVTGVRCGKPEGEQNAVTCRATVYRRGSRNHETVRLIRSPDGWVFEEDPNGIHGTKR